MFQPLKCSAQFERRWFFAYHSRKKKKTHWCGVSQLLLLLHILHEYHNSGHAGYLCTFCHLAEGQLNVLLANIRRLHRCGKLQMTISGSLSNLCSPIWKQAPDTHFISPLVFFFKNSIIPHPVIVYILHCIHPIFLLFFFLKNVEMSKSSLAVE